MADWSPGRNPKEFVDWVPISISVEPEPAWSAREAGKPNEVLYGKKTVTWKPGRDEVREVPISAIRATQPTVSKGRVAQYVALGGHAPPDVEYERLPLLVRYGGRLYVHNGHHRIEAHVALGKDRIRARIVRVEKSPLRAWAERDGE